MTEAQLYRRVERWIKQLPQLGLGHYEFEVTISDDPHGTGSEMNAAITMSDNYASFEVEFNQALIDEGDFATIDRVIIHELCHVPLDKLMQTARTAFPHMTPPTAALWDSFLEDALEDAVEKFARTLYAAYE